MKRLLLFFLLLFPFNVSASIIVSDADSGRIFYQVNKDEKKLIASTTKILTSLVVINNADLDELVLADQSILKSTGSGIYISIGEHMTVRDLLYGLLLRSGNDAAILLAHHVGGSEEGFAKMMNDLASSIGMKNSFFINASGLEDENGIGNTSTAQDMSRLMSYAIKNKEFLKISSTYHRRVKTDVKSYDWYNKNKLLSTYKYTIAGKTGYTKKAKRTLVTAASKEGMNLIVVTLNESDDFELHRRMYEKYFDKYKKISIIDKNSFLSDEKYYVKKDFGMMLTDFEVDKVNVKVDYKNKLVTVSLNGKEYYKEKLYKREKRKKLNILEKIKKFFSNLF